MPRPAGRRRSSVLAVGVATLFGLVGCTGSSTHRPAPMPLGSGSGAVSVPSGSPARIGRPNIVFVLTDDLSTDLLPYMPHVQALARAGTTFGDYFVVDSLCCPSRAAIFTGLYPHDDGVWNNVGPVGGYAAYLGHHDQRRSFAVALQAAGYETGFMGKYLNGYQPHDPPAPGWDVWDGVGNGYPEYDYQINENGTVRSYGHSPSDYLTSVLDRKAQRFLHDARHTGKPFALEVATFAPHQPAVAAPIDHRTFPTLQAPRPPTWNRRPTDAPRWLAGLPYPMSTGTIGWIDTLFRKRVESALGVDRMVGDLERTLAADHQLHNTYFVFSSDNGFHLGEYALAPGKMTAFDTDIRVPLIVTGPGVPAGHTVDAPTASIDLGPTFLQIAGARPAPGTAPDGVSMLALWHGDPTPAHWQQAVLIEHDAPPATQGPDTQPADSADPPGYEAMRTAGFLYVEYATGEREYYDLRADPDELHNIAADLPPARLALLHRQLRALVNCHSATACQAAATAPAPG